MKNFKTTLIAFLVFAFMTSTFVSAQEAEEKASPYSVGVDLVSSYVWRGSKVASGPALQPSVKFAFKGLTVGAWGSFGFLNEVAEADLYASYTLPFRLTVGATDYYYQKAAHPFINGESYDVPFFRYSEKSVTEEYLGKDTTSTYSAGHAIEINLGYTIKGLSIAANYIVNEGAGSIGGDMYFEAAYAFKNVKIFAGAGDGWHTSSNEFEVCNIGMSTSKTLNISDKLSIPVSGMVSLNPQKEQLNLVVGISF